MTTTHETWLSGGTVFDGTGRDGVLAEVHLRNGRVERLAEPGTAPPEGVRVIDAQGCWVTPGFLDLHTHYDAELEVAPALSESVRHGVTTVVIGSCGLSMAVGRPVDLADMFCRVEGIPRSTVLPLFERVKTWQTPAEYLDHLDALPLGPHVAPLLGHSTIRAHVMGLGRSLDGATRPTPDELATMETLVGEAIDAGYLGLSMNTLPWDKMDGDTFRSRPTPSVFARWSEYRRLAEVVRARGAVFQGVPDLSTRWNVALFLLLSTGIGRPGLRTMLISMVDAKSTRSAFRILGVLTQVFNRFLGAQLRWQSLPNPFDLYVEGLDVPVLEELGAGTEALHVRDEAERAALLRDPAYRKRFRRQWNNLLAGKAYHRDLFEARVVASPDPQQVGRSFGELARERGVTPVDAFLDAIAEHGRALRWYTVVGNDRPRPLEWIIAHPAVLIGFSDAGAHLRNMAYYNFPIRLLHRVLQAEREGRPFLSVGQAVHRLTGEIADFLQLDAGNLAPGARADLVVLDPAGIDASCEELDEAELEGFGGLQRLVRRNDRAVRATFVNGRLAWDGRSIAPELGRERGFGSLLRPATAVQR